MRNNVIIILALLVGVLSCNKDMVGPEDINNINTTINVFDRCGSQITNYSLTVDSVSITQNADSFQTVINNLSVGTHELIIEATDYSKYSTTFYVDSTLTLSVTLINSFDFQNIFKVGNKWVYDASSYSENDLIYVVKEIQNSLSDDIRQVIVKWIFKDSLYTAEEYWYNHEDYYLISPTYEQIVFSENRCFSNIIFYEPTDTISTACSSYYYQIGRECNEYLNIETQIQKKYYRFVHQVIYETDTTFISPQLGVVYDKYYRSNSEYNPPKIRSWILHLKGALIDNRVFGDTVIIEQSQTL